jgi:imidazolonepropionase
VSSQADVLVIRASEIATPIEDGSPMPKLRLIPDGALAIAKGKIAAVGTTREIRRSWRAKKVIDARGGLVTPGLIDAHTHIVFAGNRANEFVMRLQGADYSAIAAAGGGIQSTVRATREATDAELLKLARSRRQRMLEHGTTTAEVKSGYGLTKKDELRMLKVIRKLEGVVPTFLGAHAIPQGSSPEAYLDEVIGMLPAAARLATFCDVFCEPGYFEVSHSEKLLRAAKAQGMKIKLHAEEFVRCGGAQLAARMGATSADHLMAANDDDLRALAESKVAAVMLPTTSLFLAKYGYAPARKMVDAGVRVALGTDFNPGTSMTGNLQLAMHLACSQLKLTPAEALVAATLNSAHACGVAASKGSIELGKSADVVLWNVLHHDELTYQFGFNQAKTVIRAGRIVHAS